MLGSNGCLEMWWRGLWSWQPNWLEKVEGQGALHTESGGVGVELARPGPGEGGREPRMGVKSRGLDLGLEGGAKESEQRLKSGGAVHEVPRGLRGGGGAKVSRAG